MKTPLVSIIITTKNEANNIGNCLKSVQKQTYRPYEIIVVDNNSLDETKNISKRYTPLVYSKGPERSAQRNFGAKKAKGEYLIFLDADMVLTRHVVEQCVESIQKEHVGGVIIPEKSYGDSFWAQCKTLERSFYVGNDAIEAARFYNKNDFEKSGGFDESITGPEDWDLSQKIKMLVGLSRVKAYILHNEGNLSLWTTIKKKYYYAKKLSPYIEKEENKYYTTTQFSLFKRYWIFLSHPQHLLENPLLGTGVIFMKTSEFIAGAVGMLEGKYIGK